MFLLSKFGVGESLAAFYFLYKLSVGILLHVLKKNNEGKKIIKILFNKLNKKPKKYIRYDLLKADIKERVVSDFIAGMTDRFAINMGKNFK